MKIVNMNIFLADVVSNAANLMNMGGGCSMSGYDDMDDEYEGEEE